jgi:hypothetical protein
MSCRRLEVNGQEDGTRCICSNHRGTFFASGHLRSQWKLILLNRTNSFLPFIRTLSRIFGVHICSIHPVDEISLFSTSQSFRKFLENICSLKLCIILIIAIFFIVAAGN